MAYDEGVAQRVREALSERRGVSERKMFGGVAFMYRGHMLVGVLRDAIMARVGPAEYSRCLARPHVREMDFTGKPMKGYVFVDPAGFEGDDHLNDWVGLCVQFNKTLAAQ